MKNARLFIVGSALMLGACGGSTSEARPIAPPRPRPRAVAVTPPAAAPEDEGLPDARELSLVGFVPGFDVDLQPTLALRLSLRAFASDARGIAVVVVREDATVNDDVGCDPSTIVAELTRDTYRAWLAAALDDQSADDLQIKLSGLEPGTTYLASTCIRQANGQLVPSNVNASSARLAEHLEGPTLRTPSGTTTAPHVHRGHALVAWDPESQQLVETAVTGEPRGGRAVVRTLELSDGRRIQVPRSMRFWVPSASHFVAVDALRPGDELLAWSAELGSMVETVRVIQVGPVMHDYGVRPLEVAYPDTYFYEGLVVGDNARSRASGPPRIHVPDPSPSGAFPEPGSNCDLAARLETLPLATDVTSLAILAVQHEGASGARAPVACDNEHVVREIPREAIDRARTDLQLAPSAPLSVVVELARGDGREELCGLPFQIAVCERTADGAFTASNVLGRYTESGPAH